MAFVHLHNHTQYSMLDGACRVDKMIDLAKEYNMPAVAMTDHGNMFGAIDFYKTATAKGVKPIIGIEAYLIDGSIYKKQDKKNTRYHIVLLAKDVNGYKNLIKLTSKSFLDGFYYKPRIDKQLLAKYSEGIICLSACLKGMIPSYLLAGKKEDAKKEVHFFKKTFPDRFYLEIQDHGIEEEIIAFPKVIELAKETNTPLVVTNDCHYLKREDAEAHDVLLCIQTGRYLHDKNRMRYSTDQLYFKTEEEMRLLFPEEDEAYDNTIRIADQINLQLNYDDFLLPRIDVPDEFNGDMYNYLRDLCYKGVTRKYPVLTDEIKDRLEFELNVIHKMGYDGYFLVVKDFIDAARAHDIPVGPGRGSAAGSIVAYLLDITKLDPLQYGLLFERFLDLKRVGMPDIDIDFCAEGRNKVIEYVVEKYGRSSVTQIITFGTLGAKSVIKDIARVMEVPAVEANNITKKMPSGPKVTLESALSDSKEFRDYMNSNDLYKSILKFGKVLEGLIRHTGVHAAGVVIGPGDLSDYVPLALNNQKGGESVVLVQYEGKWLDDLKLLKMDFLGLKTLTLIKKTIDLVKNSQNVEIDIDSIPLTDKKAYKILSNAETEGVFQFESAGMKRYLSELQPNQFEDLIAMVALYRPGPMQFIDTYIKRKHGKEKVQYDHPLTENILKETYGVTVYQEQVMKIAKEMAGFSSADAGTLRKAISKKKKKMMADMYEKFKKGSIENGVSEKIIEKIWDNWQEFANYAFNKSHAACYAYIAYQTAYLKAHYPVEFMAALLSLENDPAKIPYFIETCKCMGIEVIPPNINKSECEFSVHGNKILFGLKAIKNVGTAAINSLIDVRVKNGEFKNLFDLAAKVDTMAFNKTVFESLIASGAMDDLDGNRAEKFEAIELALDHATTIQAEKKREQLLLFDVFQGDENASNMIPQMPDLPEWTESKKMTEEKKFLGFRLSGHPLDSYEHLLKQITNIRSIDEVKSNDQNLIIAGVIEKITKKSTKDSKMFAIIELEDQFGKFEMSLFGKDYDEYGTSIQEEDEILIIGSKNNYLNGNELLRIRPNKIIPLDSLPELLKGTVTITLDEEQINSEFSEEILQMVRKNKGDFSLQFHVETEKFKRIAVRSKKIKIFPYEKFFKNCAELKLKNIKTRVEWGGLSYEKN